MTWIQCAKVDKHVSDAGHVLDVIGCTWKDSDLLGSKLNCRRWIETCHMDWKPSHKESQVAMSLQFKRVFIDMFLSRSFIPDPRRKWNSIFNPGQLLPRTEPSL
jgi:hypothetical protein